jgi:1-acyl-sn-glycerol-3-phosphate acyltransferase
MNRLPFVRIPAGRVRGVVTFALLFLQTAVCCIPIFALALLKLLLPFAGIRRLLSRALTHVAELWISINTLLFGVTQEIRLEVRGLEGLDPNAWYLVIANHQSWVDIFALQSVFNRRIPFLKFFLKEQLRWVPVLGLVWWALDMPFMKRYSRAQLRRRPELAGTDLARTQRACERFRLIPTSVINFVEGTRCTPAKQAATNSPYRHLLAPRAGGVGFVLGAMGTILKETLDVTIAYPAGVGGLWALCCGGIRHIVIEVERRPLEPWLQTGDYANDNEFRRRFQSWLSGLWQAKEARLERLLGEAPAPPAPNPKA